MRRKFYELLVLGLCISILVTLPGCGEDYKYQDVSTVEYEVVENHDLYIQFNVTGIWMNTCGEFSSFTVDKKGNTFTVKMIGREPEDAVCGAAETEIQRKWGTQLKEGGVYQFKFYRIGDAPLDTTIVF